MSDITRNPYVGPRTFQKEDGDIFFGRERETRDIMALIASEKLILFYAQSGAGKSSLLNTRIVPELEEGNFEVLPVARVQGDLPAGCTVDNVFVYNLMNSILQQKTSPEALAKLQLSDFLRRLDFNESGYSFNANRTVAINTELHWRRVLLIDQFEEIFRIHLHEWQKREEFFRQIAQAMEADPYLTVMLIMREDYIASLDPYAHILPGGLRMRYYMQRLGRESALKAVKNPVEHLRPFAAGVAEKLVDDLAGVQVENASGELEVQTGQYVEPVQLQVVCHGLWENLAPGGTEITEKDLLEIGDVDQSLQRFYDRRVGAVAKERAIPERRIREWFDKKLITANKTRNMVAQDTTTTAGLPNDIVRYLQGDLIRSELRAGQIWVELSHDRLVEPVLASNAKWFETNLSVFQRRVVLWAQQGKSENLLLGEQELAEAEKEASALHVTEDEQEFLEESRKQVQIQKRDQVQRRRIFAALVVSVVLLVAAVALAFYANIQRQDADRQKIEADQQKEIAVQAQSTAEYSASVAEDAKATAQSSEANAIEQAQKALAGSLAAEADSKKGSDYALALMLSTHAHELESTLLTRTTLFDLLQFTPSTRLFGYNGPVTSLAVSPDGSIIASSSCREYSNSQCKFGEIILTDAKTHQLITKLQGEYGVVNSMAFTQAGEKLLLAAGGCVPANEKLNGCTANKGQISLWDVTIREKPSTAVTFSEEHTGLVKTIAFSHDGRLLASGSFDTTFIIWNISDPSQPTMIGYPVHGHSSFINSLAFSNDDKTLVSASDDQKIMIWNISNPEQITKRGSDITPQNAAINSIGFSPDGKKFASASDDHTVVLWDWEPSTNTLTSPITLDGHGGYVKSIAFNAEGSILATAGFDSKVILWNTTDGAQIGLPLSGHARAINAIAFGNMTDLDGNSTDFLLSGGDDRLVIQWSLFERQPLSQPLKDFVPPEGIGMQASSGSLSAAVENEQQIVLNGQNLPNIHTGAVNSLSFSPEIDSKMLLASASDDQSVILWDVTDPEHAVVFLTIKSFDNPVEKAYFENTSLITIEKNTKRAIRWEIAPTNWLTRACKNIRLTDNEIIEWARLVTDQPYQDTCKAIQ